MIPVVVTETETDLVLMLGYMNKEALDKTILTKEAHYWSRSREVLWKKGESSGMIHQVDEILIDDELKKWNDLVPAITLPVLAKFKNNFIELRFSYNDQISSVIFFINEQDIVDHPGRQILVKEENNWLLRIPTIENFLSFKVND